MHVSIRKIRVTNEKAKWLRMFVEENHSTPKHLLNSVEDTWDRPRLHVFEIIDLDGPDPEVIGITSFQMITNHLAVRQKTILKPEFRRLGIGSKVLGMVDEEMRRFGVGKVFCHVFDFNLPMIGMLIKNGYKVEAFLKDHHAPGYNEYIISKML